MKVLGMSPLDKDSTVSLMEDGRMLYAAAEERFTRVKLQDGFPWRALCPPSRSVFSPFRRSPKMTQHVSDILTARLALVAITPETLECEQLANGQLGTITSATIPDHWPPEHWEPHVFELLLTRFAADPSEVGWHRYIALRNPDGSRTLIGSLGGFRKDEKPGECEVGYSLLPQFRGHGYATEGLQGYLAWALSHPSINAITANTFPSLPKSIRVMEKCGLRFVGPGEEEGTVLYRWQR